MARDADEAEALERELALRHRFELPVERLRATEARRREPGLAPALRLALDVPGDHAVDPAHAAARRWRRPWPRRRRGARAHRRSPGWRSTGGRVQGVVLEDGSTVRAEQVVVAAGVWSPQLSGLPDADRVPVRPVKGQIMRLHDPAGPGLLQRVIRMGPSYITPRGDGRYVLGATSEERGFDTTVTAGAAFELLRDATELVPGISELVLDEFAAGLRPGTPGQPAGDRPRVGGGAALGHRPSPRRDPAGAGHRRAGRRARWPARRCRDDAARRLPPAASPRRPWGAAA